MPLELDQIYSSLDDLNVALGPNGANKNGALTDLLETTAENFGGQGAQFHQTIQDFSTAERRPSTTTRRSCSARPASSRASSAPWPPTTRPCGSSTSRSPASPTMLSGEREELAAALHNLVDRPRRRRDVRPREPRHPGQEHQAHQPGGQGARQAARRARRDAHGRPRRAQQPGADLQPAGRHPRHQRQPRRADPPDRVRPGHAGLRLPRARSTRAASCATSPARCSSARRRSAPARRTARQFDPTLGGLVEVAR